MVNSNSSPTMKASSAPSSTASSSSGGSRSGSGSDHPYSETQTLPSYSTRSRIASTKGSSSSNGKRRTMTEFVESRFASIERLCNPISSAVEDMQTVQKSKSNSTRSNSNTANVNTGTLGIEQNNHEQQSNNSKSKKSSSSNTNNNTNTEDEDEDEEAYATLTYLALLTSLYLPLLLFLWIRRSMFGTASLCRSLFLGHMLRLVLAFMLLPPSTTKTFVPTWLWNFGLKVGHTAERLWNDRRTQAMIPTWFHLALAFLLGIENENIPSSAALANLGSNNEKDTWPPPALVALGIFTFAAFVVHPDGLTWIMLGQIRKWIQSTFEKTTDGIRMIRDGTIKITLAEMSGVLAGIIIIVTIVRALLFQIEPTEKVRTPHREKRGHRGKKGKKGKGGRHHHNNHQRSSEGTGGSGSGNANANGSGKGRIRAGNNRSSKDVYESRPRSRSPSPSGRARCESDMENTTVSAVSDLGNTPCVEITNKHSNLEKKQTNKNVDLGNSKTPCVSIDRVGVETKLPKQSQSPVENKKTSVPSSRTERKSSNSNQSKARENNKSNKSSMTASTQPSRRSQISTNGEKQKRGHGRKNKNSKQNNSPNSQYSIEVTKSDESNLKLSTPTRQANYNAKSRKNHRDDRNRNQKAKEIECDTSVGSSVSYSNSNSSYFSSNQVAPPIHENEKLQMDSRHRRRSFTDPHSSQPQSHGINSNSPGLYQPMSVANRNAVTPPLEMPLPERDNLMRFQEAQQTIGDSKSLFSGTNKGLYNSSTLLDVNRNRHEAGSFLHNQMHPQLDTLSGGLVAQKSSPGSPNLRGLNGAVIRPPPGLVPPQNPVGSSSLFVRDSSESSQQGLPYMSASTVSLYSNFSSNSNRDMALNNSQACNERFNVSSSSMESSERNASLAPMSPIHRRAPAPIGHERALKFHNDEEIEGDLLNTLGGQMAGSILDF